MGGVGRSLKPSENVLIRQGIEVCHFRSGYTLFCLLFCGSNGLPVCGSRERVNRYVIIFSEYVAGDIER